MSSHDKNICKWICHNCGHENQMKRKIGMGKAKMRCEVCDYVVIFDAITEKKEVVDGESASLTGGGVWKSVKRILFEPCVLTVVVVSIITVVVPATFLDSIFTDWIMRPIQKLDGILSTFFSGGIRAKVGGSLLGIVALVISYLICYCFKIQYYKVYKFLCTFFIIIGAVLFLVEYDTVWKCIYMVLISSFIFCAIGHFVMIVEDDGRSLGSVLSNMFYVILVSVVFFVILTAFLIYYSTTSPLVSYMKCDYNKAIQLNPRYTDAYFKRGNTYFDNRDYDRAMADYSKAIQLDPRYTFAYYNRGNTYFNKGNYDQAIVDYSKTIQLDSQYTVAYYDRGNAYFKNDNYDQAIIDYSKAIQLNPEYADAYRDRGEAYLNKGDYMNALYDYTAAISFDPNYKYLLYQIRGLIYDIKKDYAKAIVDYTSSIQLNPEYADAYRCRGKAYFNKGNYNQAVIDFETALRINPNDVEAKQYLKKAYKRKIGKTR